MYNGTMKFVAPANQKIPEMESEVLDFWKREKIFEKSVESRPKDNLYVFYDGPPFISGSPHYGHLLGSVAKDVIPRYWTMKGKRVERVWGWDAHGLTVENRVQKKLGIKNRRDIEAFGLEKFTKECYKYTSETSAEWGWYIDRVARWVDMETAYKTTDQSYMESVMWAFKQLYDKGLIYEGLRTSLYCTTCGTPVSNFEIAMDNTYKEVEDPSVTVKFPVTTKGEFKGANLLAWTTTPWTLPPNRALVVDEKVTYTLVDFDDEKHIVAKARLEGVFGTRKYSVEREFKGKKLVGLEYEAPFQFFAAKGGEFKVYTYEGMVNMEEGTGIVHSSPGFGDVDTEMGRHYDLTIMTVVDDEGKFTAGDAGKNPWEGVYFSDANEGILEDLEKRNLLFENGKTIHRYPYHDRCDTLLIHRAQESWFIKIEQFKKELLKTNEKINWVPEHNKHGRFYKGIEQAPDWCISRNRFWATPMPVWEAEDGDRIVVESVAEIEKLSGQKVKDLHRPYIDKIIIEKSGKKYRRRPEVLDSWMEAGSMPFAQIHYPFENQKKFEKNYPGDYIAEYVGQVRAWFYVMHVLSTALFGSNSFKNAIVTGVMSGSDGRKMSKTYENYTDPKEILETLGGDALRLYLMNSPLMNGENMNFDDESLRVKSRNVLNPLWNSARFFLLYAAQHTWEPPENVGIPPKSDNVLDQWIIARLHETIRDFSQNMEKYLVASAVQPVEDFVDDLSRWYVRRSRDRVSIGDEEAMSTLYYVLVTFARAAAPIIPFMAEKIYLSLVDTSAGGVPESVHLCDYPGFDKKLIEKNQGVLQSMAEDRKVISTALSIRVAGNIPVRQPISSLATTSQVHYEDIAKSEVNVKKVISNVDAESYVSLTDHVADADNTVFLDVRLTQELKEERMAREMVRAFQDLRKKEGLNVSDRIEAVFVDSVGNRAVVEKFGEEIKRKILAEKLTPGEVSSVEKI